MRRPQLSPCSWNILSFWRLPSPWPLQFAARIQISGAGTFAVGASCESHNPGPGSPAKPNCGGSEPRHGLGDQPTGHGFLSVSRGTLGP